MTPRRTGRTQECDTQRARVRLRQARAFLQVAELVGAEDSEIATPSVTAALAVLAGIAASDAMCCAALGRRSRGQDHQQATMLLNQISPDGPTMARDLERLLGVKDDAHYGLLDISGQRTATALRQAQHMVETAAKNIQ